VRKAAVVPKQDLCTLGTERTRQIQFLMASAAVHEPCVASRPSMAQPGTGVTYPTQRES